MNVELNEVLEALENDRVVPFFQPITDLRTGELQGFEVLARYAHPELGHILPENFIPLIESHGLIGMLTHQVFSKAFQQAPQLPAPLVLSLNISPLQMRHATLPTQILAAAEESGFPMNRVKIEITETALLHDLERPQKIARELKEMGCCLSLDDFGTGASSLRHLHALPLDELKVDRSFVSTMTQKRESRKIVAAVVGLGQSLGLTTVAEGIETEEQAATMLRLGCERGQGWLYGRPVPAGQLPDIIQAIRDHPNASPTLLWQNNFEVSSLEAQPTLRLAQLRAIYDGAPVGLCFLDKQLRYVNLNERLARMNGAPVAAHLGRTVKEMMPGSFERYEPFLLRALRGEAIGAVRLARPSHIHGEADRIVLASYQPVWDEADEVIGVSVALIDITEHLGAVEPAKPSPDFQPYLAAQSDLFFPLVSPPTPSA